MIVLFSIADPAKREKWKLLTRAQTSILAAKVNQLNYQLMIIFTILYNTFTDGIPARYVMALVTFSGYMSLYLLRLNVNIAIVGKKVVITKVGVFANVFAYIISAMVNYTAIPHTNITTAEECGLPAEEAPIHDPSKVC